MKLFNFIVILILASVSVAEPKKCYEIGECLAVAGLDNVNLNKWPLSICDNDEILSCLIKSKKSCGDLVKPYIKIINNVCGCVKTLRNCQPQISKLFKLSKPEQFFQIPNTVCSNLVSISTCVTKTVKDYGNCPENVVDIYEIGLSIIQKQCENKDCINSYGECAKKSFDILKRASKKLHFNDLGLNTLKSICSEIQFLEECFESGSDESKKCDPNIRNYWKLGISQINSYCSFLPCYGEIAKCGSIITNYTVTSMTDPSTIEPYRLNTGFVFNLCSTMKDDVRNCFANIGSCPSELSNSYKIAVEPYYTKTCDIFKCSAKINECSRKIDTALITSVKNDEISFDKPNLVLICENLDKLNKCYASIGEDYCKPEMLLRQIEKLDQIKIYCANPCLTQIDSCVSVFSSNAFGSGDQFSTIDQCISDSRIKSCFSELAKCMKISEEESNSYIQASCQSLVCSETILECAKNLLSEYKEIKFNKYGLAKICMNVKNTYKCLTDMKKDFCMPEITKKIGGPEVKEQIIKRCERVIRMVDPKIAIVTKKQFIVLSVRFNMPWDMNLLDMSSREAISMKSKIENSLEKVYENEKDFKSVSVIRFYQGSVAVDHSVEYDHSLTNFEVIDKARKLTENLSSHKTIKIGDNDVLTIGSPKLLVKGNIVTIDGSDACELRNSLGSCGNGGSCIIESGKDICKCAEGFEGDLCENKKNSASSIALSTMILSITVLIVSMFI